MKLRQYFYSAFGFVVLSLAVCRVQASMLVYQDVQFLSGETHLHTPFEVTAPGLYKAELVDYEYPAPFDILSVVITQDDTILGFGFDTGSFTFNVLANNSDPITLLAHLTGLPQAGEKGLYGLRVMQVPIPASFGLFLTALAGIVIVGRRGSESGMLRPLKLSVT